MSYKLTEQMCQIVTENAARELYEYCKRNGIHYTVLGISGGLDSAVTLGFAAKARELARKDNYLLEPVGLIMPCNSTTRASELAQKVIDKFQTESLTIDLSKTFDNFKANIIDDLNLQVWKLLYRTNGEKYKQESTERAESVAQGNIKARLRMIITYHVARLLNGLVLSTDNLSELWMGFWTICGDVGDFGMIQNILKGLELYDIARYIGVPQEIIDAAPDDGLGVQFGGDEAQLGASYPVIDQIMINMIQNGFDPLSDYLDESRVLDGQEAEESLVKSLAKRCQNTAYKRRGTINLTREELGLAPIKNILL